MQLYLPEEEHPAFGVVRAVVKDASDADQGAASEARAATVYLRMQQSTNLSALLAKVPLHN